ncbi:hypothetical protein N0B44_08585 [Roseibacterium beibuensis]|uniref:hypothetical protein n=1 Tax=[Roseibacterium] beibuensis TaxID=1193142 RepID=UPI00217EC083|nr:hypothetical protein [Roseibacterium beibuensis]MCS6622963.1 hypothetical protein [Roseibacterium beibuensis]
MAEPGDPNAPDDHDDLVGFASPASLQGRARAPEAERETPPAPEREPEPDPAAERDLFTAAPAPAPAPVEPELAPLRAEPAPEPEAPPAAAAPVAAASIFEPSPEFSTRQKRREPAAIPGGGMGLYAVYALILFAVPTLGVSAIIGLLAVTGRAGPDDPLSRSHFVYQQRTLWTAAVAVAVGLIFFLVPFGLGPAIMFFAALWLVARGAAGVWSLKAGRPIADPRGWWI